VLSIDVVRAFDVYVQAVGYEPFKMEDVNTGMLVERLRRDQHMKITSKSGQGWSCNGCVRLVIGACFVCGCAVRVCVCECLCARPCF
jgi:hypothetical protein